MAHINTESQRTGLCNVRFGARAGARVERRLARQLVHRRLLRVQITLQRILDRRVAQRLQRPEVVTDRGVCGNNIFTTVLVPSSLERVTGI